MLGVSQPVSQTVSQSVSVSVSQQTVTATEAGRLAVLFVLLTRYGDAARRGLRQMSQLRGQNVPPGGRGGPGGRGDMGV